MKHSFLSPLVAAPGEEPVDEGNRHRENRERPDESVGTIENKLDGGRPEGHEQREEHAARPGVGRRLGIGDHEKCEEEKGAAFELMERNRRRLAEPERPAENDRDVESQKGARNVAS